MRPGNALRNACLAAAVSQALAIGSVRAATITVTSDGDSPTNLNDGVCTLREAVRSANANVGYGDCSPGFGSMDTIVFSQALAGQTITLSGTQIEITTDVDILGPGASQLTVSGNNQSRIFRIEKASVTMSGLTLAGGSVSSSAGGAIRIDNFNSTGQQVAINNSVITGNRAGAGGGIYHGYGLFTLSGSTVSNNSATSGSGGGIFSGYDELIVTESTISGNSASSGGGIEIAFAPSGTITNSTISGNRSSSGGGIGVRYSEFLSITATTVSGNTAATSGGGLFLKASDQIVMKNSTISANTGVSIGGGIYAYDAFALLYHTTITGNSSNLGGGINIDIGTVLGLVNTIVANSTNGADCRELDSLIFDFGGNIVESNTFGANECSPFPLFGPDPKLGPLANNGGPTQTHALLKGSPAIDAGFNAECLSIDQRSITRDLPCDIGAFEVDKSFCFAVPAGPGKNVIVCL